jgi:hypothetical protein
MRTNDRLEHDMTKPAGPERLEKRELAGHGGGRCPWVTVDPGGRKKNGTMSDMPESS